MIRRRLLDPGLVGLALGFAFFQACGKSDDKPPSQSTLFGGASGAGAPGGAAGRGGGSGSGVGGSAGDAGVNPLAPVVTITKPLALSDPNLASGENPVLPGTMPVEVVCKVVASQAAGAALPSPASVTLELLDAKGERIGEEPSPAQPIGDDEYRAEFALTNVPSGVVGFRCNASDISDPPIPNSASINTFVDQGPKIVPLTPTENEAKNLRVDFRFEVTPELLAPGDEGAGVSEVKFGVAGKEPVVVTPLDGQPGVYFVPVDFGDGSFDPIPQGLTPVTVIASNSRNPQPIPRTFIYRFNIDSVGPTITINAPATATIVGGLVELRFTVTDGALGSGVDRDSVTVQLNSLEAKSYKMDSNWEHNPMTGAFIYRFDSGAIGRKQGNDAKEPGDDVSQVTVLITAKDLAMNPSGGQDHSLYLDNYAPIVDLDPGNVREFDIAPNPDVCSVSFDPVGADALNDLDPRGARSFSRFRVLGWDRTNAAPGQETFWYSVVDKNDVHLFIQGDLTIPLVIDTNGDGVCDEINRAQTPYFRKLDGLAAAGAAWYGTDDPARLPALGSCAQKNDPPPKFLCTGEVSDLTRVIKFGVAPGFPAVFAQEPAAGVNCTGVQWQIGNHLDREGWICLAARAVDGAKNVGISRPLRVCYDDSNPANGAPDCSGPPPSCAQPIPGQNRDCELPPKFTPRPVSKL